MPGENVILLDKTDGVARITLNRPDKLNAFNDQLSYDLLDALKEVEKDSSIRAIIITGAGRGFCSGQDLQARFGAGSEHKLSLGDSIRKRYNPIITKIRSLEKPIIAAVNGVAAGAGASLAFACDFRVASTEASFIQSFTKVGLVPDSGSTFFLPRLIGATKALELMFSAEKLDAQKAFELGLVNLVVGSDKLAEQSLEWAKTLAKGPSLAFALTKRAVNKAMFSDLEELLEYEAELQEIAGNSKDFAEGVKAFMEKRPPRFTGE